MRRQRSGPPLCRVTIHGRLLGFGLGAHGWEHHFLRQQQGELSSRESLAGDHHLRSLVGAHAWRCGSVERASPTTREPGDAVRRTRESVLACHRLRAWSRLGARYLVSGLPWWGSRRRKSCFGGQLSCGTCVPLLCDCCWQRCCAEFCKLAESVPLSGVSGFHRTRWGLAA